MNKHKKLLFLWDVIIFTLTAFGGPPSHVATMLKKFVHQRHYIKEDELLELNALTQVLPGPSSTQTLVGVAWKVGGISLALVTFFIWILPSSVVLFLTAVFYAESKNISITHVLLNGMMPAAIALLVYAVISFWKNVPRNRVSYSVGFVSFLVALVLHNAYSFPLLLLLGGFFSAKWHTKDGESKIEWSFFRNVNRKKMSYFIGVLLLGALLGWAVNRTSPYSLPIRLFENFYRNGVMVLGGGQVLVSLMFTEFVEMKHYLSQSEFLAGFTLQQVLPGPIFSFSSFVGAMSAINQGGGLGTQILSACAAVLGINLPGLILILFIVPFWNDLRKIVQVKNFLTGINTVAFGFMLANLWFLYQGAKFDILALGIAFLGIILLIYTRIGAFGVLLLSLLINYAVG